MKKKVKIYNSEIKRSVRRGLMENMVEQWEMKDTYSRAGYTQGPKEKEIEGVFGQYGEDIPPAVLRYMRKNPKAIIKRLYDVYGQQMFDYISDNYEGGDMDIEVEDEVVMGEEEDLKVYDKSDVSKVLDDDAFNGSFGYKEADDDIKMVTVNEINKIYEGKKKGKCPAAGCIKKVGKKWRVISNKTGKLWPATYDSKKDAEEGLDAYHANK
jgi:hypothetical protein